MQVKKIKKVYYFYQQLNYGIAESVVNPSNIGGTIKSASSILNLITSMCRVMDEGLQNCAGILRINCVVTLVVEKHNSFYLLFDLHQLFFSPAMSLYCGEEKTYDLNQRSTST